MWMQCMCTPGYPTCVCIRGWRPVCEQDVQVWQWQMTTRAWWGRTWQRWGWSGIWWWGWRTMPTASAWSYTRTRWGRGMCLFNGRHTSSVFYSSITKMLIKMIKLDPVLRTGSNLIRVLLERGVDPILYIRIFYLELLEFLTIQLNAFIWPNTFTHPNLLSYCHAKHGHPSVALGKQQRRKSLCLRGLIISNI